MEDQTTKAFYLGAKVKFQADKDLHPDLRDKEFCLLGFHDSAFAIIEWDKRGGYGFDFYTGSVYSKLEAV